MSYKRRFLLSSMVWVLVATMATACNIPVFRYALERWRPDETELVVFHRGPIASSERERIDKMRATANVEVAFLDLDAANESDQRLTELWQSLSSNRDASEMTLPYSVLRLPHPRGIVNAWQGPLAEGMNADLIESPCRKELSRRLLSGHAIVWLLIGSSDASRNAATCALLQEQNKQLSRKLKIPEGVGLPGSELFSEIPLLLKFSVLEIDPKDAREQFMVGLIDGLQPGLLEKGQPLVVPVFGRGRALEVIPADILSEQLIADLSAFLCAACSCQVKEQNPGFDLLLSEDWETSLFGEGGTVPGPAKSIGEGDLAPRLLTIPPGK